MVLLNIMQPDDESLHYILRRLGVDFSCLTLLLVKRVSVFATARLGAILALMFTALAYLVRQVYHSGETTLHLLSPHLCYSICVSLLAKGQCTEW